MLLLLLEDILVSQLLNYINKQGKYEVGKTISGIEDITESAVHVFHAGTGVKDGRLVTSGGRVLAGMI